MPQDLSDNAGTRARTASSNSAAPTNITPGASQGLSARRRSERVSNASSQAAIALPVEPRVIAATLEGSALADDEEGDENSVDIRARYGRKASRGAEKGESAGLTRGDGNRRLSTLSNQNSGIQRLRALSKASAVRTDAHVDTAKLAGDSGVQRRVSNISSSRPDVDLAPAASRVAEPSEEDRKSIEESITTLPHNHSSTRLPHLSRSNAHAVEQLEMVEDDRDTGKLGDLRGALVMAVTGVAQLLDNVSMTSVNIALPDIGRSLNIGHGDIEWLISAYALTFAGFLLLAGVVADRYGKKTVFLSSLIWLSLWTLICGFAQTEIQLIIFRAIQGLGAAGTVPSAIGIISTYFLGHDRNRALSIFGACGAIGFVLGLVAGGLFTALLGWRYIFRVTSPVGFAVAVVAFFVLPKDRDITGPKPALDFLGAGLGTGGMILLTFCLSSGGVVGWSKAYIIALIIVSVLMLVSFAYAEKKVKQPIMPLYLWRTPNFAATWLVGFLAYCFWGTVVLYIVLVAQEIKHLDPLHTAAYYAPMGAIGLIASVATGRVAHAVPVRVLLTTGMLVCAITPIPIAVMKSETSFWLSCFPTSVLGVTGISISYNSISIAMMAAVPPAAKSLAGGLANTAFQLGNGVGLAIASAVAQAVLKNNTSPTALLESFQAAMWACVGFCVLGAVLSWFGAKPGRVFVAGPVAH